MSILIAIVVGGIIAFPIIKYKLMIMDMKQSYRYPYRYPYRF